MIARDCTCAGPIEGWGCEWWCGLPELDCSCGYTSIDPDCVDHGHLAVVPEETQLEEASR